MVARRPRQDAIPPGWTVQLKQMRSGRTIRYFMNSQNGQMFSSEEDLIHYIKMTSNLNSQNEDPPENKRHIEGLSENIDILVVKKTNEEWLPDGWEVQTKTCNSGSKCGTNYKCYIDPSTGSKFYSKPEVFRYLEGLKGMKPKCCLSNQKKAGSFVHSARKALCATERPKPQHPASRLQPFAGKQDSDRIGLAVPETEDSNKMPCRRGSVGTRSTLAFTAETLSGKASMEKLNDHYVCPSTNYQAVSTPACDLEGRSSLDSGMGISSSSNNSGKFNKKKLLNLPCRSSKRLAGLHSKLTKVEFLEINQQDSSTPGDRAVLNSSSDILGKNSLEWGTEKSSNRNNSGKTNEKDGLFLPCRSSKRLSGLKTVLPKMTDTNQQKSNSSDQKAVSNSEADLIGKSSRKTEMLKSENMNSRNYSGKSNMKEGIGLPLRSSKRLAGLKTALPKLELSKTNLQVIPLGGNKAVLNFAALEKGIEKSSRKRGSNNYNKKSKLEVPRRSSKRLAGLKADMSKKSSLSEQVLQNAIMESENEVVPHMGSTPNFLEDEASGPITELAQHASSIESIPSMGKLLNKSQKSLDDEIVPAEQFQALETEKSNYENSDLRFGDPCLDFAFKTLTGAMPLEDAIANIPIPTCAADILHKNDLHDDKMKKSCNKKFWIDVGGTKHKKELNLPCWSLKQTVGLENELVASSALQISAVRSCQTEPNLDFGLSSYNFSNGSSQELSGLKMGLARHDSSHPNAPLYDEPLKSKQIHKDHNVTLQEPHSFGSGKVDGDNPVSDLFFSSRDYWSDPCLEFAFKILTGAIPLDHNLAKLKYSQPKFDTSHKERDGNLALPDFGLPSHFQSDISSQLDALESQPSSRQQLPLDPSVLLSPGNKSLPSCSAGGAQQRFMEQNKDIQGKEVVAYPNHARVPIEVDYDLQGVLSSY